MEIRIRNVEMRIHYSTHNIPVRLVVFCFYSKNEDVYILLFQSNKL
jgi:hypothetical protein